MEEKYAISYSADQDCFHYETLARYLEVNREILCTGHQPHYSLIAIATRENGARIEKELRDEWRLKRPGYRKMRSVYGET